MKVELITKKGKLQLDGATLRINANPKHTLMIRAEIDEGNSPLEIMIEGAKEPVPIKRLKLVNKETTHVHAFSYQQGNKKIHVKAYDRAKRMIWNRKAGAQHE